MLRRGMTLLVTYGNFRIRNSISFFHLTPCGIYPELLCEGGFKLLNGLTSAGLASAHKNVFLMCQRGSHECFCLPVFSSYFDEIIVGSSDTQVLVTGWCTFNGGFGSFFWIRIDSGQGDYFGLRRLPCIGEHAAKVWTAMKEACP